MNFSAQEAVFLLLFYFVVVTFIARLSGPQRPAQEVEDGTE